jgi:hypothetical protein
MRARGRKRNPVHTKIYNELSSHLGTWGKLNINVIDLPSKKRIEASLRARARKDGFRLSVISSFNEVTKNFDVWMKLYR